MRRIVMMLAVMAILVVALACRRSRQQAPIVVLIA